MKRSIRVLVATTALAGAVMLGGASAASAGERWPGPPCDIICTPCPYAGCDPFPSPWPSPWPSPYPDPFPSPYPDLPRIA